MASIEVFFKANLIFKDFSRQSCIFKYFSSMCEPSYNGTYRVAFNHGVYKEGRFMTFQPIALS